MSTMAPEIFFGKPFHPDKCDAYSAGVILFTLSTGYPPYEKLGDKYFQRIVWNKDLRGMLKRWNCKLEDNAVDLLEKLICSEEDRLTIQEVVKHPYVMDFSRTSKLHKKKWSNLLQK